MSITHFSGIYNAIFTRFSYILRVLVILPFLKELFDSIVPNSVDIILNREYNKEKSNREVSVWEQR